MEKLQKASEEPLRQRAFDTNGGSDRAVLQVARRVAATIGTDFFRAIALHLAKALKADCVLIGEFAGGQSERVKTLGACLDGQPANFEYALAGSASARVAFGRHTMCRSDVQNRYPLDTLLPLIRAQACIGVPLLSSKGGPLGIMMAAYRRPVATLGNARTMLDIFASRAAAELSRKREEESLRESEQRHRAFIARNPDAMWRVEFEQPIELSLPEQDQLDRIYRYGYLAECNDSLARLLGIEKAERLIGSRLEDIQPLTDPSVREATLLAIRSGYRFTTTETSPIDRSGHRKHILRSQWGIVEEGKLERLWGTSRDITDLKQTQRALDASEQRIVDLLESMRLAVVIVDSTGGIAFCNNYFFGLTGWSVADVAGKAWLDLLIPEDQRDRLLTLFENERDRPEEPIRFESTVIGPAGRRWQFDWDRVVLRDRDGKITAWANLGRDVTEHKELEEHFRQSQKLASIGRVAGGVAHDFNNLLTVMLGYSSALLEGLNPSDPAYVGLTEIRKAASKGAELTQRLLAFSRRQVLRPEVLSINTLLADAEHMIGRLIGDDVRLTTRRSPSLGLVRLDPGSFHQVLLNLAVNARDAMPTGGDLSIITSNVTIDARGPFSPAVPPGEYVQVTFSDTGIGMSEEVRSHLFEPFFTTKEHGKGTGLGLSVVYGIVQQSGGRIIVETAAGRGTTFRLFFPRVEATVVPVKEKEEEGGHALPTGGTESILLVDDRDDVRQVTAIMLAQLGYSVLQADGPEQALELARDRGRIIHLLLTDLVMPGMGGFELANLVKTYHSDIKVLFMSGNVNAVRITERLSEPGFAYLRKPFTPEELASNLRQLLNRS